MRHAWSMSIIVLVISVICTPVSAQTADFPGINFSKADSVAARYPRHSMKDMKVLADKLTTPFTTDVEKFRAVFRWVTDNIEYDVALYIENGERSAAYRRDRKKLRRWNEKFSALAAHNARTKYKTVCGGYASLIKELCDHAGIQAVAIEGIGRNHLTSQTTAPNHAWNAVKLEDRWYLCDATWSAGVVNLDARHFFKRYSESYFLTPPHYFIRDHLPSDTAWALTMKKPTPQEFIALPLFYGAANALQLNTVTPSTLNVNHALKEEFVFTFTSNRSIPFEKASIQIEDSSTGVDNWIYPQIQQNNAGEYYIEHKFEKKGTYNVTVFLNYSACVGYVVRVK
jgi:hypothetical protein